MPKQDSKLIIAVRKNKPEEVAALLMQEDTDPDAEDINDQTALMVAASLDSPEVLEALLKSKKVKVNFQNSVCDTALLMATRAGNAHAVARLIFYHARPNLQNTDGQFALFIAVSQNRFDIVASLLAAAASPVVMCQNLRAIDQAILKGDIDRRIVDALFNANKGQTKFVDEWTLALKVENMTVLEAMVCRNFHKTIGPRLLMQAFSLAVAKGHYMLVSTLVLEPCVQILKIELLDGTDREIEDLVECEKACFLKILEIYCETRSKKGSLRAQMSKQAVEKLRATCGVTAILQSIVNKSVQHATKVTIDVDDLSIKSASFRALQQLVNIIEVDDAVADVEPWKLRLQLRRGIIVDGMAAIVAKCKPPESAAEVVLAGGAAAAN